MNSAEQRRLAQRQRIDAAHQKSADKKSMQRFQEATAQMIAQAKAEEAAEHKINIDKKFIAEHQWEKGRTGLKPAILLTYPALSGLVTNKQTYDSQVQVWKNTISDANRYHLLKKRPGGYDSDVSNDQNTIQERDNFLDQQNDFVTILETHLSAKKPLQQPQVVYDFDFKPAETFDWKTYQAGILKTYPEKYLLENDRIDFENKLSEWRRLVDQATNHHYFKKTGREKTGFLNFSRSTDPVQDELIEKFLSQQRDFIAIVGLNLANTPKSRPAKREELEISALPRKSSWCCFRFCCGSVDDEKATEHTTLISGQQKARVKR